MKQCTKCLVMRPIVDFHARGNSRPGNRQSHCRFCTAKIAREFRQHSRDVVGRWKLRKGCSVCGFKAKHPCQLDLHHLDPTTKTYKGSHKSYDAGWSMKRIKNELAKCIVICKNCHSLETHESGHWKNTYTDISMRQSSAPDLTATQGSV